MMPTVTCDLRPVECSSRTGISRSALRSKNFWEGEGLGTQRVPGRWPSPKPHPLLALYAGLNKLSRKERAVSTVGNRQMVEQFWQRMSDFDFAGAGELLHEDYVCEWPQSRERIRGRANFVALNAAYPGRWQITIKRIVACD